MLSLVLHSTVQVRYNSAHDFDPHGRLQVLLLFVEIEDLLNEELERHVQSSRVVLHRPLEHVVAAVDAWCACKSRRGARIVLNLHKFRTLHLPCDEELAEKSPLMRPAIHSACTDRTNTEQHVDCRLGSSSRVLSIIYNL